MSDTSRRDLLLGLIQAAIAEHDRWVNRPDLTYITAGVDEAMSDMISGFAEGSIPSDCRDLAQKAEAFATEWQNWQAEVDRRGSATIPPSNECWQAWEALVKSYRGVSIPDRPPIESVAVLRHQKVADRQICEIYGWMDSRGRPEIWRVEEEITEPGKHTNGWVDPVTRRRQEADQREQSLAERVKRLRERKVAHMSVEAPETLAELIQQNVPLKQIAEMLRMSEDEVFAQCDAEHLPRPAIGQSIHTIPSQWDQEISEPMARQFAAQEARGNANAEQAAGQSEESATDSRSDSAVAVDGNLPLEQQVIQLHLGGLDAKAISDELSTGEEKVSARKVATILKRYAEDPNAVAMP